MAIFLTVLSQTEPAVAFFMTASLPTAQVAEVQMKRELETPSTAVSFFDHGTFSRKISR
jgi:hypothetical protein